MERLPKELDQPKITASDLLPPHILPQYDPVIVEYLVKQVNSPELNVPEDSTKYPIAEVRANPQRFAPSWAKNPRGWERVESKRIHVEKGSEEQFEVMIYSPEKKLWGDGPWGCHLNFHGGGFVLGSLNTESLICRNLSDKAGVVVVDVGYRHCPEVWWGKGVEDAWTALNWVKNSPGNLNIKPDSISIGGISAGGTITLILQHLARDTGVHLRLAMPTVPAADPIFLYDSSESSSFPSFREFAAGPVLGWDRIAWFGTTCFPREPVDKFRARIDAVPGWWIAPLKAKRWDGLCRTLLRTAGCDPIRDEAEAYANKLVKGGGLVTVKRYKGAPHIFMFWDWYEGKKQWDLESVLAIRKAHGT